MERLQGINDCSRSKSDNERKSEWNTLKATLEVAGRRRAVDMDFMSLRRKERTFD